MDNRASVLGTIFSAAAFLAAMVAPASAADDADAIRDFKGIRILIWAFDRETAASKGFSEAVVHPGMSATLEPFTGHQVKFVAGAMMHETLTIDFVHEWEVSTIPLAVTYSLGGATTSMEGSQYLTEPDIYLQHDGNAPIASIAISTPVGSLKSPELSKALETKFKGETGELEDLLIAMARAKQVDARKLIDVYFALKHSARLSEWKTLSQDKDQTVSLLGLVAGSRIGDQESITRFCNLCISSSGNDQVRIAEMLVDMPANDRVLETMLKLAALPNMLILHMPAGVSALDMDRRSVFRIYAAQLYKPDAIQDAALRIIAAAPENEREETKTRLGEVLTQISAFRAAATAPSDLSERMRQRRLDLLSTQPATRP